MRLISLLALLLAACATTRPADFSHVDDPDSPDRADCIAAPDACFRQAQQLVQRDDTLSEGVHRLFTACKYKSVAACELLNQHAKVMQLGDGFQMPFPDMNRFFRECQDLDLYAICKISAARVLESCRAPRETLAEMPDLLSKLNGQPAQPVTWDGKPVTMSIRLTFKYPAPSNPNQPTHCTPGQTWH